MIIKREEPLPGETLVPFERSLADAVEALIQFARKKGATSTITTQGHWEVVEKIFTMWYTLYPEDYELFRKTQIEQKSLQKNKDASAREGEARVQHMMNIPKTFYLLLKVIFPRQRFDRTFVHTLSTKMPLLKMPESKL